MQQFIAGLPRCQYMSIHGTLSPAGIIPTGLIQNLALLIIAFFRAIEGPFRHINVLDPIDAVASQLPARIIIV